MPAKRDLPVSANRRVEAFVQLLIAPVYNGLRIMRKVIDEAVQGSCRRLGLEIYRNNANATLTVNTLATVDSTTALVERPMPTL
jgi:hypothetical protein